MSFYDSIPDLGPCIESDNSLDKDDYPRISIGGVTYREARFYYYQAFPDTDPELTVDHLCQNKKCIELYHLDAITREENTRRALSAPCQNCGSEDRDKYRACINCRRIYMKDYMRRLRSNGYIAPSRRK